jgi:hypothetical protein
MRPIPGENRLFTTWKAACDAAEAMKGHIVTQSILIDADGQFVFPGEGREMATKGRWIAAVNFRYRHRGVGGTPRSLDVQENTGPARGRADRSGRGHTRLSPKVVDRIAHIRKKSPDFGRRAAASAEMVLSGRNETT